MSAPDPIVLVQGPESARYWVHRRRQEDLKVRKWVVYDSRSAEIFEENGLTYVRDKSYLDKAAHARMKDLEKTAYCLSGEWYKDAPDFSARAAGEDPELFAFRGWAFYYLVVFRALVFLQSLLRAEGKAEIWTTRRVYSGEFEEPLRWTAEDSPLSALLEHFQSRALCEPVFFDLETPVPKPKDNRILDTACAALSKAAGFFKLGGSCRVLLYGNPTLLDPVAKALRAHSIAPVRRVRRVSRSKELVMSLLPGWHLMCSYQTGAPEPFDEHLFYQAFLSKRTFCVEGEDLLPVLWPKVRNFYRFQAPALRRTYRDVVNLISRLRPEYLIVEEDAVDFGKMLTTAARRCAIKSLVVQHGLPGDPLGFMPMQAEHMAAWGEASRQVFERWGMDPSRIVVTGCPKYDSWEKRMRGASGSRAELCRRFGWPHGKPIVLITPDNLRLNAFERFEDVNPDPFEVLEIARNFIAIAKAVPEVLFLYKFHGGGWDAAFYEKLGQRSGGLPPNFRWMTGGVALDFMAGCDLVFNDISSAGLEAVLLRRPLVNFNFSSQPDFYPAAEYGLEASAHCFEEALGICRRLADGTLPIERWLNQQERLVPPYALSRDGGSAERVACFVEDRLRRRRPQTQTAGTFFEVQAS